MRRKYQEKSIKNMKKVIFALVLTMMLGSQAMFAQPDSELSGDGLSKAFHKAYDAAETSAARLKAIKDEQVRQAKYVEAYFAIAKEGNSQARIAMLTKAQNEWKSFMKNEEAFLVSISTGGKLSESDEFWKLEEMVARTIFMRNRSHLIHDETGYEFFPRYTMISRAEREGHKRYEFGFSNVYHDIHDNYDLAMYEIHEKRNEELELQDKWLNADYKAIRALLNDAQKSALLQSQRAWLRLRDVDTDYIYNNGEDGTIGRDEANYEYLEKLCIRTARLELLLARLSKKNSSPRPAPNPPHYCRIKLKGAQNYVVNYPGAGNEEAMVYAGGSEFLAIRHKIKICGGERDGSLWYELVAMRDWDEANMKNIPGKSLAGRSAQGNLLDYSGYVEAKFCTELPLRDGDEAALRAWATRYDSDEEFFMGSSLRTNMYKVLLDAAGDAEVVRVTDEESPMEGEVFTDLLTKDSYYSFIGDIMFIADCATPGAKFGKIIVGKSTESEIRKLYNNPEREETMGSHTWEIYKHETNGMLIDFEQSEEFVLYKKITFSAKKSLTYEFAGEGGGLKVIFYIDAKGVLVSILCRTYGWN